MTPASTLSKYKAACEVLKCEISMALQDYEFKKNGKLWYAVDFSEIYAYILPSESFKDFIIFPDAFNNEDELANAIALQQLVLRYIFFNLSPDPKLVLLSPYLLEFRTFVQSLPTTLFVNSIEQTLKVFNDLEKIIDKNTDVNVEIICNKIAGQEAITLDEEAILINFIREYGYIQSFLERGKEENHPFSRVKHLHPNAAFTSLDKLISPASPAETELYDRWVVNLQLAQKKIASTELDAAAINLIYEANRNLDQNTRLILITRSASMNEVYQSELKEGLWEEVGEFPLLRHPRVFSVALAGTSKSNADDLQDLRDLRDSIDLFLEAYEAQEQNELVNDQILTNQVNKIKQEWKRIQKTAFPFFSKSEKGDVNLSDLDIRFKNVKQARTLLGYARNTKSVKKRIGEILDEIFCDIDIAHDVLGLELQPTIFHLSFLSAPRKVNFTTEAGKCILSELYKKSEFQKENFINAYRLVFELSGFEGKREEEYERNLAMGYILGSLLGQREVAEKYCLRAINIGERTNISTHEAVYFQAVYKREAGFLNYNKEIITQSWLSEILDLLDKAIAIAKSHGVEERLIARYWVEKGISILQFHDKCGKECAESVPTATEGIQLLRQWDEKLDKNLPLRLYILRTELHFLVTHRRFRDLLLFEGKFRLLENLLIQYENEQSKWPSFVVDLMYWGKWVLFTQEFMDTKRHKKLLERLDDAMKNEPNGEIKNEISQHIKDIRKGSLYG